MWGLTLPFPPLETSRTRLDGSRSLAWEKTQVQQMKRRKNTVALPDAKTCGKAPLGNGYRKSSRKKRSNTNFEVSQIFRVVKLLKNFISIGMWTLAADLKSTTFFAPFLWLPSTRETAVLQSWNPNLVIKLCGSLQSRHHDLQCEWKSFQDVPLEEISMLWRTQQPQRTPSKVQSERF